MLTRAVAPEEDAGRGGKHQWCEHRCRESGAWICPTLKLPFGSTPHTLSRFFGINWSRREPNFINRQAAPALSFLAIQRKYKRRAVGNVNPVRLTFENHMPSALDPSP